MKNNKVLISLGVIIGVIIVALIISYLVVSIKKPVEEINKESQEVSEEIVVDCNYENDNDAYGDAVKNKNIGHCECIKDEPFKGICKKAITGIMLYDQALAQLDDTLCEKIESEVQKEACHKVVSSTVEQLKKDDPQRLAAIYAQNHNQKAIAGLEEIIEGGESDINHYIVLALSYAEKGLSEQEQGRDREEYINKAFSTIEEAKKIDTNNSEVYRVEAYINEVKPDYIQAITLYDKALEINQNNIFAHAGKGHVFRMIGSLEKAVEEFDKAAELNEKNDIALIYTNLCTLEYSRSEIDKALENCKIAVQIKDADIASQSGAYQIMAKMSMDKGDFSLAENYLLRAKSLTPSNPNLYVTMADLYLYKKDYQKAEETANRAITLAPTKAGSYLALSRAIYMQEKYDESIVAAQTGITLVKDDVSLLIPSKPAVERDLNYVISYNYRELGDPQKQADYEQRGATIADSIN